MFSPFVFTWHGAGRGSDRFYAWLRMHSLTKKERLYVSFSICIYAKKKIAVSYFQFEYIFLD
ncbi:hypothetical protein COL29_04640 [Bacillus pseudomycoides]|nr:hypothetical protein COL29_04640 [Bacillus pseudomycoides]